MPQRPLTGRYTAVAVALHWLIAIGILYNLWQGLNFDALEAAHPDKLRPAVDLHKSIGITVIGLVAMRILWRISHAPPAPLPSLKSWERGLSAGVHHLLYTLMFVVPFAGWLHDSAWKAAAAHPLKLYGVIPWFRLPFFGGMTDASMDFWHKVFGNVHTYSAYALIGAVGLHIVGALKHQFLDGQRQFARMWFGS